MVVKQLMSNLKMTVRAGRAASAYSSFPQPIKALAPWLSVRGAGGSQPSDRCLPSPPVAGVQNKLSFPPPWPLLTAFERPAANLTLGYSPTAEVLTKYLTACTKESVV